MAIVTGDRYLERLVRFVDRNMDPLLEGTMTLKLNPSGLYYVQSRLETLRELERLIAGAPVDYLRAYISDLGDHRALEQLRRILRLLTSLKVFSVLPPPDRDPTPLSLMPFGTLRVLELRGCDLSTTEARGLLELRHSLEKLICHNSTDALRHVFASRIVDIKDSPVWNRLSFVSCACNGLVLMDESLQLLPAVETLDLSRNKFAKVDNLRKCMKLRYLDLGFNSMRTVASLSVVSCPIAKLVLRNNALTALHGIENLKEVEGIDLSYNIISNFSELEVLSSLSSLKSLWLEGNPVCCARWYRAHVFSFFRQPNKLEIDGKGIDTKEYWEMQAILTSRQKQPAGYGFYFPAKDSAEEDSNTSTRKKKHSRLACIDEEERRLFGSEAVDQESNSCDGDHLRKDDSAISDSESEIQELINRVEAMKKERSVFWLRDFREWLEKTSDEAQDVNKKSVLDLSNARETCTRQKAYKYLGESSMNSNEVSEIGNDVNMSGSGKKCSVFNGKSISQSLFAVSSPTSKSELRIQMGSSKHHEQRTNSIESSCISTLGTMKSAGGTQTTNRGDQVEPVNLSSPFTALENIMGSHSSSSCAGSPPQYKEDILHRRQDLEDEFVQFSSDSCSSTSDSDTSCSDEDSCRFNTCNSGPNLLDVGTNENVTDYSSEAKGSLHDETEADSITRERNRSKDVICSEQLPKSSNQEPYAFNSFRKDGHNDDNDKSMGEDEFSFETRNGNRKHRKRPFAVSMVGAVGGKDALQKYNGNIRSSWGQHNC